MKKILFGTLLLGALFTACSEDNDYNAGIASPQSSAPTVTQSFGNGSVTEVGVINLAEVTSEAIQIANIVAPAPTSETAKLDSMVVSFINENDGVVIMTTIKEDGLVTTDFLKNLVESFYGKRPVERTINAALTAFFTDGKQSFVIESGEFKVKAVPAAPHISENYYIVGGPNDWNNAPLKQIKFNHSGKDVYEDPVFSVVFDAAASGDTWFAIGDDEACEAIPNDWSKLLGIVGGESQSTDGRLDVRSNMGQDNSFCVPAGAKKIKVTINMMEYTFKVEPVSIADSYYLIGGPGDWNADAAWTMMFSHSGSDVFSDPVFTYTFEGGKEMWFAFGDSDAITAVANGDWSQLYGYVGDEALSGSFDRRSNIGEDHSFHIDGAAKFYRLSVNMADFTYTITPLDFAAFIWQAGNGNGWGSPAAGLYGADGDGKYQGYMYLDGEFKFRSGEDNWNAPDWGIGGNEGTLAEQAGNLSAEAGFYRVDVDLAAMTYSLKKIENVSIIGTANGNWDTDTDLTYNQAEGCWEVTTDLNAGEMKFRGNHNWDGDVDLGGSFENLAHGGANIAVEAGNYTIKLYISYAGKHHAVVTKN